MGPVHVDGVLRPAPGHDRKAEQTCQVRPGTACGARGRDRRPNLAEDLGLPDHTRLEPGGDTKQVQCRFTTRGVDYTPVETVDADPAVSGKDAQCKFGVGGRPVQVQLGAIAVDTTTASEMPG